MKYLPTLLLSTFSLLFISCGENTSSSPLNEITSISLVEKNISLYATDRDVNLSAKVFYNNSTSAVATGDMAWSSSDNNIFTTTTGKISAEKNGGDAEVIIDYQDTFSDKSSVHVKKLLTINYTDLNISDIGNPQTIKVSGNFENNETDVKMKGNILWSVNSYATISESNASQITLTVDYKVSSITLSATLFSDTDNAVIFDKTFN